VLGPEPRAGCARIRIQLESGAAPAPAGILAEQLGANAMAPLLPLLEMLIGGGSGTLLIGAGPRSRLRIEGEA
ncbi:MAG: hypothetical protein KY442_08890, partial [Proteobacteria bacterium]|nr:hypothetical protein [Pseudomonadota bacterium]